MKTLIRHKILKPRILGLLAVTLGFILYLGQACQINGGGYGGFKGIVTNDGTPPVYNNDGIYSESEARVAFTSTMNSTTSEFASYDQSVPYNNAFYTFSKASVCSSSVPALGQVGDYVSGMIYGTASGGFEYRADACSNATLVTTQDIIAVDFDPLHWIYQNKVFTRYASAPSQTIHVKRVVAQCLVVDPDLNSGGIDTGTSVTIYRNGSQLFAEIYRGLFEDPVYRRYHLGPIEVQAQENVSSAEFSAFGLSLQVNTSVGAVTGTGVLTTSWNKTLLHLNMDCWRFEN